VIRNLLEFAGEVWTWIVTRITEPCADVDDYWSYGDA
jgi:hypothetical protein